MDKTTTFQDKISPIIMNSKIYHGKNGSNTISTSFILNLVSLTMTKPTPL